MFARFLHWFSASDSGTGGVATAEANIHYVVEVDEDGTPVLYDTQGKKIEETENIYVYDLFDDWWFSLAQHPAAGTYSVTYNPETRTFSGFPTQNKRYRLIYHPERAPRLIDHTTGQDEEDPSITAELAAVMSTIEPSVLQPGEYHLSYDPGEGKFHGFGKGDSGGGGASDVFGPAIPEAEATQAEVLQQLDKDLVAHADAVLRQDETAQQIISDQAPGSGQVGLADDRNGDPGDENSRQPNPDDSRENQPADLAGTAAAATTMELGEPGADAPQAAAEPQPAPGEGQTDGEKEAITEEIVVEQPTVEPEPAESAPTEEPTETIEPEPAGEPSSEPATPDSPDNPTE